MKKSPHSPFPIGSHHSLSIHDIGHSGDGVGRLGAIPVFVPGALPGETVEVEITATTRGLARGRLIRVTQSAQNRVTPPCGHAGTCGGCQLQHLDYPGQIQWKRNRVVDTLSRIGQLDVTVDPVIPMADPRHYRNKVIVPFGFSDTIVTGFFATGSHHLVPISDCLIQDSRFQTIIDATVEFANRVQLTVYDEVSHRGLLRAVMLRASDTELVVGLVINGTSLPHHHQWVETLRHEATPTGIGLIINQDRTNVPVTDSIRMLYGSPVVTHTFNGLSLSAPATGFFQVNSIQTRVLLDTINQMSPTHYSTLFDLYCGVGGIGLSLAHKCQQVFGNEWTSESVNYARQNAITNGFHHAQFEAGDAALVMTAWLNQGYRPDIVVVDPPRKGCSPEVIECIRRAAPKTIIYVSCDPGTLARDLRLLSTAYHIDRIQPIDMFPHTAHIETVVALTQR